MIIRYLVLSSFCLLGLTSFSQTSTKSEQESSKRITTSKEVQKAEQPSSKTIVVPNNKQAASPTQGRKKATTPKRKKAELKQITPYKKED